MKTQPFALLFLLFIIGNVSVLAQDEATLRLTLSRDWGYGAGLEVQGRFSYHVEGPDDLIRVVFLLDGETIGEDNEPPFSYQFQTESYEVGRHTLSAIGYTSGGNEITSNQLHREFVSGSQATQGALRLVIPILALSLGSMVVAGWIASRGARKAGKTPISGAFGGTICPKCSRPFALHWWKMNLIAGALDRCPHCGKWSMVRRVPESVLQAAAEALEEKTAESSSPPPDSEEKLRKQLDDSRFQ